MATQKGSTLYHNPETKEALMFLENPGHPWIKGRPPWQPQRRDPDQYIKSSETKRKRMLEQGPTEAELEGYRKQSKTRLEGDYSPAQEVRQKIRDTLTGRPQTWVENKSRSSCVRSQCDTVYILRVETLEGKVFGKWGSSKEDTFKYREREFKRKGFKWEVIYWGWHGEETSDVEASIGRRLSRHPASGVPHFYGHTETFDWSQVTQKLLKEIINGLG
jgi:hypothetical protein